MTEAQPSRIRLLRVFRVVVAAFRYCWHDLGRLVLLTWLACALASATRLVLEWLVFPWPPRLPAWLLFDHFEPPTWLMAFALTPFLAMGWAFVLSEMEEDNTPRGAIGQRASWMRFELSRPVLIAAAIMTVVNLIDAGTRFAQFQALYAIVLAYDPSERALMAYAGLFTALRVTVIVAVLVWLYPLAGMVLRGGRLDIARLRMIMRGNWLRVAFIFLLLSIILRGLYRLLSPAANWLIARATDSVDWTLQAALIRFVVDFPFQMLWIVAWAVTVGIVLITLDPPSTRRPGAVET